MKLLITGGCGFIGSNFIINRMKTNPDDIIINCDKITYSGNVDNLKVSNLIKTTHMLILIFVIHHH